MLREWFARLHDWFRRDRLDAELREELQFHADRLEADEAAAATPDSVATQRASRRRLGNVTRIREEARDRWSWPWLEDLHRDVRHALRGLARTPTFTGTVILTLALGIGVTTAIFTLVSAVLLEQPPVRDPDRLAVVYTTCRSGEPRCSSSYPDYQDYRDRSRSFDDMAAYSWVSVNLGDSGASRLVTGQVATGNYFSLLGVTAATGRLLRPEDDRPGSPEPVVVLSYDLWQAHFAGAPDVVGRTVRLNGSPYTVVGVTTRGFRGMDLGGTPELWIPLLSGPALGPSTGSVADPEAVRSRGNRWISAIVGRLADGASVSQARSEMLAISGALAEEDPKARGPRTITVDALSRHILPVSNRDTLVQFTGLLAAVVGFTLLLACANLTNLMLSRAATRRHEIGIRIAIGAGRLRLVRQLLVESGVLTLLGGAVGILVALGTIDLLAGFALPGDVVLGSLNIRLDGRMLTIALAVSVATGLLFGLAPALQGTRLSVISSLKGTDREAPGRRGRLSSALVVVQVALCLVLLVGSGLFLRTLGRALAFDPGFATGRTALARFDLGLLRYEQTEGVEFVSRLVDRVRGLPGVDAASVGTLVPFQQGGFLSTIVTVDGYEPAPDEELRVNFLLVESDYFQALGLPILRGREFGSADGNGAPPVLVVSETMARRWWPGRDALGGRVRYGTTEFEVVGVAGDARWRSLAEPEVPFVFVPLNQFPSRTVDRSLTLIVRTGGPPSQILSPVRATVRTLEPGLSLSTLETMEEAVGRVMMPQRMGATLLTLLGALALTLAMVGIYGVVAYRVAGETRNIGIRMALGASASTVLREVVSGGMRAVALGIGIGLALAIALTRVVAGLMFEVDVRDPLILVSVSVLLAGAGLLAGYLPARRVTRIKPVEALRHE